VIKKKRPKIWSIQKIVVSLQQKGKREMLTVPKIEDFKKGNDIQFGPDHK